MSVLFTATHSSIHMFSGDCYAAWLKQRNSEQVLMLIIYSDQRETTQRLMMMKLMVINVVNDVKLLTEV